MAKFTKDQVDAIVSKVTANVLSEMEVAESQNFDVTSLRDQVSELAKIGGGASAWEISYKTKMEPLIKANNPIEKG